MTAMMGRAFWMRATVHQALEDADQLKVFARSNSYEGNRNSLEGLKRIAVEAPQHELFGGAWGHADARRHAWGVRSQR